MTDRTFAVGDTVRHMDTDIIGEIVAIHYDTNEVVIRDLDSEYEAPEDQLVYRPDELKLYKKQIGG
jgi:hypothetical protein